MGHSFLKNIQKIFTTYYFIYLYSPTTFFQKILQKCWTVYHQRSGYRSRSYQGGVNHVLGFLPISPLAKGICNCQGVINLCSLIFNNVYNVYAFMVLRYQSNGQKIPFKSNQIKLKIIWPKRFCAWTQRGLLDLIHFGVLLVDSQNNFLRKLVF